MTTRKTPLTLDRDVLSALLDGSWAEFRRQGRALAASPALQIPETADLDTMREATLGGVRAMADSGLTLRALPEDLGGRNDHAGYVASFEETLAGSPSVQVKAGVQFGLFGGAIQHLGSAEQHARWLLPAQRGELLGCFAMTEIGHGSDVAALATTAVYLPETEEFAITTPFRAATKEYIGNAAVHGTAAIVFAKLITEGVDHGVHAFFVPIRDASGQPLPGVRIEDSGHKGGLRGVDNGRLAFDDVRIPRTDLLPRYGDVAADGTYSSPIDSPGRRFFTMLGTLVQGRVSLDGAAVVAAKLGLDIAVRYSLERRQFTGASDTEEVVLLDYQRHQRRLMPLIAETYANALAHEILLESFQKVFSGEDDSEEARQILETQAAGFKATSTWGALRILQECREACGGAGFMSENRLTGLRADLDVYATFEGDNTVLLQLVGKRLLQDYAAEFSSIDLGGAARYLGTQAAEHTLYRSGLANVGRTIGELLTPALTEKRIRSGGLQQLLLSSRVDAMVSDLASRLRPAGKLPRDEAAALFNDQQHALVETAQAYIELLKWEALNTAMRALDEQAERADEAKALRRIRDLYGLSLIERRMDWHIMYGRLSMNRARQVGPAIDRLCAKLAGNAADLVAAFGYGPDHRRAVIAEGAERIRQEEARDWFRAARARADFPIDEKDLREMSRRSGS